MIVDIGVCSVVAALSASIQTFFVVLTFRRLHLLAQPDAVLELRWPAYVVGINTARGSKNSSVPCLQNRTHSATLMRPLMK
jgi:hypothetical protein